MQRVSTRSPSVSRITRCCAFSDAHKPPSPRPRRAENASPGNKESASIRRLALRAAAFLPTPMLFIPARRAASMPAPASSTTMQDRGSAPGREAAMRKTCGSGLPAVTSSAETVDRNHRLSPSASGTVSTFARGADDATACRQPSRCRRSTHSAAPGSGARPSSCTNSR